MAATGNITISGNVSNINGNAQATIGPTTLTSATAYAFEQLVNLSIGANTIAITSGVTCLVIVGPNGANPQPNPTYGGTLTLKGVTGDTGVPISAKYPIFLAFDTTTAPSSIVINATVATTVQLWGF